MTAEELISAISEVDEMGSNVFFEVTNERGETVKYSVEDVTIIKSRLQSKGKNPCVVLLRCST